MFLDIDTDQVQCNCHHFGMLESRLLKVKKLIMTVSKHNSIVPYVHCTVPLNIVGSTDNFHQASCMFH